ncbi:hypothetical protein [Neobacillus rhizophilus]|uniref:Uncharacterized protein n=1 Tax=Neobacillus rhizophilus TaxID=2833579 RepID=A0A942U907_9BACI|nr:hypothetical protein [Neobacillus rhizophilus]MBS4215152.1 hypothetical protein [Neobacillus rhizophilus]
MNNLKEIFLKNNYNIKKETTKAVEFENIFVKQVVYLLPNQEISIVLNPKIVEGNEELETKSFKKYHSTALKQFPKKRNKGKQPINYGYSFKFQSDNELNTFLSNFNSRFCE